MSGEPYVVYRLDTYGRRQYLYRQLSPVDCRSPISCKEIAAQGWVNSLPKAKTYTGKAAANAAAKAIADATRHGLDAMRVISLAQAQRERAAALKQRGRQNGKT
jgi:hypothetical protein